MVIKFVVLRILGLLWGMGAVESFDLVDVRRLLVEGGGFYDLSPLLLPPLLLDNAYDRSGSRDAPPFGRPT